MENSIQYLAEKLGKCIAACRHCFDTCLNEDDVKMMVRCIKLDVECADICSLTLSSVTSKGEFSKDMVKLCAAACEACAAECGKHDYDHCRQCAQACTECAEVCRPLMSE